MARAAIDLTPASLPAAGQSLRERLRHVLWLGGSACSGKTETARRLAAGQGLAIYHIDDAFERHRLGADPRRYPAFCRVGDLSAEELWQAPAAAQAADLLAFHGEHLEMVIEDLLRSPSDRPLLVEGSCLLPARVAELVSGPRQALWLVATPRMRRRHYGTRGPWVAELLAGCTEPRRAFNRWMARDDALASWRRDELTRLALPWLNIDGRLDPPAVAAAAARHFGLASDPRTEPASRCEASSEGGQLPG
jgi:hypothetical protein